MLSPEEQNNVKDSPHATRRMRKIKRPRKTGEKRGKKIATRRRARKEKEIRSLILEVSFYVVFLVLLLLTAMNNRDPMAFGYRTSVLTTINVNKSVEKIKTIGQFWNWTNKILVPFLYPQKDWAGKKSIVHPQMVSNFASYRIGPLRLRQQRVADYPCDRHGKFGDFNMRCAHSWSMSTRDIQHYHRKWKGIKNTTEIQSDDHVWTEWEYRPWSSVGGTPLMGEIDTYPPGGYLIDIAGDVHDVKRRIQRLQNDTWLDARTRFLIVEMTLYCPHANLFAMVPIMFEFPQADVLMGNAHLYPFRLFSYLGHYPEAKIICDALVYAAISWFLVREVIKIWRERRKYFKKIWNIIELVNLLLSITVVALYVGRHIVTSYVAKQVTHVNGQFYNFQTLALWDELFGILVGFVCFLSTIQMLYLLRFNRRMSIFAATLREAAGDLSAFFLVFWLVFLAFALFCYMMFGTIMVDFSSVPRSIETLVCVSLGDFDYKTLRHVNRVFAPVFLFLYMMFMVFILLNMLITILNDSFAVVREDISKKSNDHELLEYILKTLTNCSLWKMYPFNYICVNTHRGRETKNAMEELSEKREVSALDQDQQREQQRSLSSQDSRNMAIFKTSYMHPYDGFDQIIELNADGFSNCSIKAKSMETPIWKEKDNDKVTHLSDSFMLMDEFINFNHSRSLREQEVPDLTVQYDDDNIMTDQMDNDDSHVPSMI